MLARSGDKSLTGVKALRGFADTLQELTSAQIINADDQVEHLSDQNRGGSQRIGHLRPAHRRRGRRQLLAESGRIGRSLRLFLSARDRIPDRSGNLSCSVASKCFCRMVRCGGLRRAGDSRRDRGPLRRSAACRSVCGRFGAGTECRLCHRQAGLHRRGVLPCHAIQEISRPSPAGNGPDRRDRGGGRFHGTLGPRRSGCLAGVRRTSGRAVLFPLRAGEAAVERLLSVRTWPRTRAADGGQPLLRMAHGEPKSLIRSASRAVPRDH